METTILMETTTVQALIFSAVTSVLTTLPATRSTLTTTALPQTIFFLNQTTEGEISFQTRTIMGAPTQGTTYLQTIRTVAIQTAFLIGVTTLRGTTLRVVIFSTLIRVNIL
jgi:hypothetical protein